ncbi:MAG: B-box zinc finger protein [Promethearchaeota archaeon]
MVELTQLEIIAGFSSIVQVLIAFFIGFLMIYKYFLNKDRNLLLMGIIIILLSESWWAYSIVVILILTTGESFPVQIYILISQTFVPLALLLWMLVMTNLIWKNKRKLILSLTAVLVVIYETLVLYTVFVDPSAFVIMEGPLDIRYISWLLYLQIIFMIVSLITATLFFRELRKSPELEIRLKGLFYLIANLTFATGTFLDAALPLSLILLVIVRILLLSGTFEAYFAFAMPKWMEKLFFKKKVEKNSEESAEDEDVFSQFFHLLKSKPKEITEEEVKFYREQTVCLVCKNQLVKYILAYICQNCRALYCVKCARAISKLENACWACNAPVDESKPVKLFKKDEKPLDFEGSEESRKKQIK